MASYCASASVVLKYRFWVAGSRGYAPGGVSGVSPHFPSIPTPEGGAQNTYTCKVLRARRNELGTPSFGGNSPPAPQGTHKGCPYTVTDRLPERYRTAL